MAAKFWASYPPDEAICVDEQLMIYCGRCPFKNYLPSKPGKWSLKLWICADVETSYCLNFEVYIGRVELSSVFVFQRWYLTYQRKEEMSSSRRHLITIRRLEKKEMTESPNSNRTKKAVDNIDKFVWTHSTIRRWPIVDFWKPLGFGSSQCLRHLLS